jgi:hypothetical protein
MDQAGDVEQALLAHARRQTAALEQIVNLMWFWLAVVLAGVVLVVVLR